MFLLNKLGMDPSRVRKAGCVVLSTAVMLFYHGMIGFAQNGGVCLKEETVTCPEKPRCNQTFCSHPPVTLYGPGDIDRNGFLKVDYFCPSSVDDYIPQNPTQKDCVSSIDGEFELRDTQPRSAVCYKVAWCAGDCEVTNRIAETGFFPNPNNPSSPFPYAIRYAVCKSLSDPFTINTIQVSYFSCTSADPKSCPPKPAPPKNPPPKVDPA